MSQLTQKQKNTSTEDCNITCVTPDSTCVRGGITASDTELLLCKHIQPEMSQYLTHHSLISLTHHCYNLNPGSRCGWTCNQLTSKVDGGITGSQLRWSSLTYVRPHNPATGC